MRVFLVAIKTFFTVTLVCAVLLFVYALGASPVFRQGERHEFYLGSSSSARIVSAKYASEKLLLSGVAGESVRYRGDKREELEREFKAELLFSERAADVDNYYYYSPLLSESVELNGYQVNLHVALSKEMTVAGTPLIFGGF